MRYSAVGYRTVEADSLEEAAAIFAARSARKQYGRSGCAGRPRRDSWAQDGSSAMFEVFIGRPAEGGGLTGRNEWICVIREEDPLVGCECGSVVGRRCSWMGPESRTVVVEYMPEHLRESHIAAGNRGVYPDNGAVHLHVSPTCADEMAHLWENGEQTDKPDPWVSVVPTAEVARERMLRTKVRRAQRKSGVGHGA